MIYTGIGSRNTPTKFLTKMTLYAAELFKLGYTLRSGGAAGADSAFEKGSTKSDIFKSGDAKEWSFKEVIKHFPNDRNPETFNNWNSYTKGLMARNMMQVLGADGKVKSDFLICYAPTLDYTSSTCGGTGYAIRCALYYDIEVYNIFSEEQDELLNSKYLGDLRDDVW